jgi:hypothetical protein
MRPRFFALAEAQWAVAFLCVAGLIGACCWTMLQHGLLQTTQASVVVSASPLAAQDHSTKDFAASLAGNPTQSPWMVSLHRSAQRLSLNVTSLNAIHQPATANELSRDEFQIALRGPYPQVKLLIQEMLDQHPTTTVLRLQMRSTSPNAETETTLAMKRWGRPLSATPGAAAARP